MAFLTVDQFKTQFDRNFSFGTTAPAIRDSDIELAFSEADAVFNDELYSDTDVRDLAYSYLAAHFIQADLDASLSRGQSRYQIQSRSAGSISASLYIPDWMKSGEFAAYATTYYGQKWLLLTKPYLDGVVAIAFGSTTI